MSASGSSPAAAKYQTAWSKALEQLNRLSPEKQKFFDLLLPSEKDLLRNGTSPDDILRLLQRAGESKHSRFTKINNRFVKPFSQFQGLFEMVSSTADDFGKIDGFLSDMLGKLEIFRGFEEHFKPAPNKSWDHLYDALASFYVDVIDFTLVAAKYYRRSTIKYIMRRLIKSFDGDFGDVISNMQLHLASIAPAAQLAAIKQSKQHYEDLSHQMITEADVNATGRSEERDIAGREWLSGTGMDADLEQHQSLQLPGTCKWFFENSKYSDWLAASCSSRLCVLGIPGSGKSVISSALIHRLKRDIPPDEPVLYFFCKKNDQRRNSTSIIIRTIMLQLLCHSVHGPSFSGILRRARADGVAARDNSLRRLWGFLNEMLDMLSVVYLVLDGLDECSEHEKLKDFLENFAPVSASNGKVVKVFATYRPNEFAISGPSIEVEECDVEGDINAYAHSRIDKSRTLSLPAHKQKISDAVKQRAGGTFLWVKLMLDILQDSSAQQIQDVLADIPRGLSDTYRLMLERVCDRDSRSAERCRKVLHWCVAAPRLLTVDELLLALAVSEGVSSHEQYDAETDQPDSLRILRLECGSLIHVLKDNSVQLVHTSLQEYLLREVVKPAGERSLSMSHMQLADLGEVHRELATVCLRYNQFTCFEADVDLEEIDEYEKRFPLSPYAISNWIYHVINSGYSHSSLANEVVTFLNSKQGWKWLERCDSFSISQGHLQIFQGELIAWVQQGGSLQDNQAGFSSLRNFILHLSHRRYDDLCRETEGQGGCAADAEHALGTVYSDQGRYDEALEWYGRALAGYEKALGKEHPSTLDTVNNMANAYSDRGRYDEALEWYGRALAGYEKALGKEHPSTLDTVNNMAIVYTKQGRYDEALEWYGRALAGKEKALGKEHPSTLDTVNNMAGVYSDQGRYDEALEWNGRALAGMEKALGKEHPSTLDTVGNMAILYSDRGRYDEALEWNGRALAGYEKALGKEHQSTLATVNNMANVYNKQGRYDEALEWYGQALAGKEKALGKEHPSTLATVNNMAIVYSVQGRYDEALEWYGRVLAGSEKALGKGHPSTLDTVNNMAGVYSVQGRYDEALEWYGRGLAGREKALGKEHPSTLATVRCIQSTRTKLGIYEP